MKVCDLVLSELEFGKGQLLLVGGRPAMGKTSFARSVSIELAQKGHKVGYFSLELDKEEWLKRAEKNRPLAEISTLPVEVLDEVPRSVADIEKNATDQRYDLLIVDYLQLVDRGDGSIEETIKDLRKTADTLGLPIIVLSQLSRQVENRENHMPTVEDLKAGGINADLLDQVFLLYRGHYYDRNEDPNKMIVVKKKGSEQLEWDYDSLSVL